MGHLQRDWAAEFEAYRVEETILAGGNLAETEAFQCGSVQTAQERASAERCCRIGILQAFHELMKLEEEAFALAARAIHLKQRRVSSGHSKTAVSNSAAASCLNELCPGFDLGLLSRLRGK